MARNMDYDIQRSNQLVEYLAIFIPIQQINACPSVIFILIYLTDPHSLSPLATKANSKERDPPYRAHDSISDSRNNLHDISP